MLNYFNYFTEIEHRFSQRRGSLLLLSTLDWALIEAWREAGIPLEAVLRGIDDAFDKHDARAAKGGARLRKVNGLAWCAQSVMVAVETMKEASIGTVKVAPSETDNGFEDARIAAYLKKNADALVAAHLPAPADEPVRQIAARLRELADEMTGDSPGAQGTEGLEQHLSVLEEKLFAALMLVADEEEAVRMREQAARDLAPYRGRMPAAQIKQVTQQFLNKRLLETRGLPRLSLFYMELS